MFEPFTTISYTIRPDQGQQGEDGGGGQCGGQQLLGAQGGAAGQDQGALMQLEMMAKQINLCMFEHHLY